MPRACKQSRATECWLDHQGTSSALGVTCGLNHLCGESVLLYHLHLPVGVAEMEPGKSGRYASSWLSVECRVAALGRLPARSSHPVQKCSCSWLCLCCWQQELLSSLQQLNLSSNGTKGSQKLTGTREVQHLEWIGQLGLLM